MLQVVVLMLLLGSIEAFKGLNADVYRLGGFFCQGLDSGFREAALGIGAVIDGEGVGVTAIDELPVRVKGVDTGKENIQKLREGYGFGVKVDADGFSVAGALVFDV